MVTIWRSYITKFEHCDENLVDLNFILMLYQERDERLQLARKRLELEKLTDQKVGKKRVLKQVSDVEDDQAADDVDPYLVDELTCETALLSLKEASWSKGS